MQLCLEGSLSYLRCRYILRIWCCQRTTARKTPQLPMGWGVGEELTKSWPTLCTKSCPGGFVLFSRANLYTPPPTHPHFWPWGIFQGGGWGCIFWGPTRQEFYTPPPFYTPPTPRRVFSGVGGWACIKFGPVCFSPTKSACTIRLAGRWPRVGHGLPAFNTNISVLNLQGSFLHFLGLVETKARTWEIALHKMIAAPSQTLLIFGTIRFKIITDRLTLFRKKTITDLNYFRKKKTISVTDYNYLGIIHRTTDTNFAIPEIHSYNYFWDSLSRAN